MEFSVVWVVGECEYFVYLVWFDVVLLLLEVCFFAF